MVRCYFLYESRDFLPSGILHIEWNQLCNPGYKRVRNRVISSDMGRVCIFKKELLILGRGVRINLQIM